MSRRLKRHGAFWFALVLFGISLSGWAGTITVFAAASLTDSLKELGQQYEKQTGDEVVFNFAASSTLARQIESGAPADLFFSADERQMQRLAEQGMLVSDTRTNILSNTLVIVVAAQAGVAIGEPRDLTKGEVRRIALGDPKAVPIGVYARQYLEKMGLWKELERKIVPTENVRAALSAVESGNAEASIVYKTDAKISNKVRIAFEIPAREGPSIIYPAAVLKGSGRVVGAKAFLNFLNSERAGKSFEKFGFLFHPGLESGGVRDGAGGR